MSIVFCVNGKFTAFDYCKNLNKLNKINKLITTYPYYKIKKYGLKQDQVKSFVWLEIIKKLNQKIFLDNGFFLPGHKIENFINSLFDFFCSIELKKISFKKAIFFSGSVERSIKLSKKKGAKCFLIRGSSHILEVKKILEAEKNKTKINIQLPYPELIKREQKEYLLSDRIFIHSKFALNSFKNRGIKKNKLSLLPIGLDKKIKTKRKTKKKIKNILYLGQITPRKGILYLLEAFESLNLKNVNLFIAGPAQKEMKKYLIDYCERNKNIQYFGRVSLAEKNKLFKKSDIFCLPTLEDGFAKVIIEAIEYQNYLLVSKFSAGPDIVNKDKNIGLIFDPKNKIDFKKKIKKSLNSEINLKNSKINLINIKYNWFNISRDFLNKLNR